MCRKIFIIRMSDGKEVARSCDWADALDCVDHHMWLNKLEHITYKDEFNKRIFKVNNKPYMYIETRRI